MAEPMVMPEPKVFPYLTIIPGRRPEQKMHEKIGHAKNAFEQHPGSGYRCRYGKLYQYIDGEWVLLYDIPEQTYTVDEYTNPNQLDKVWIRHRYSETRPWKLGQPPLNETKED